MKKNSISTSIFISIKNPTATLTLLLLLVFSIKTLAQAPNVTYKGPLVITKGGTYSGNYSSSNSKTPAISINTDQPVIIENAIIKSAGNLIYSASRNCNVVVRNTRGYGLTPSENNKSRGRFFLGAGFKRIIIENNYMESTAGIYIDNYKGSSSATETVRVRYNKAKNIDGRHKNGGRSMAQFCVLNNVRRVKNIEISWNEVINLPNQSAVEDNINMHYSSGTSDSPILIHNNYIQGAYPTNLSAAKYSGGGIMLADGAKGTASQVSSYVKAYNNHVVGTTNYGMAIAGGNNNLIHNNRIIACGYAGSKYLNSQNVGIYILNLTKSSAFHNNTAKDNVVGWVKKSLRTGRNDFYMKDGVKCTNNKSLPGSITASLEKSEHNLWLQKVSSNKKRIGVISGSAPLPVTAPPPASDPEPEPVAGNTVRVEAENYKEVADPGSNGIGTSKSSSHSNGKSVKLYDAGDKIKITVNVSNAGKYVIKARVRSGYYTSSSSSKEGYWKGAYKYWVNGSSVSFAAQPSTIGGKDASYGGSYWGTMSSSAISLKSGSNTIEVSAAKKSYLGIDYIEVVPSSSSSSQRIAAAEEDTLETDVALEEVADEEQQEEVALEMVAYPNPANDLLNIESGEFQDKSFVSLYNSAGEPVISNEEVDSFDKRVTLDLQKYNLNAGMYFLKVQTGDKVFQKKIFKN